MGEVNYEPFIRDMTWSFSRLTSFEQCKYKWYLKYIRGLHGRPMFFSSYGSFVHKILNKFYTGELRKEELATYFLIHFGEEVCKDPPSWEVYNNYFKDGLQYFRSFKPEPFNVLSSEKRVNFLIIGTPMVGFIDLIGEDERGLIIEDHKSRALKQRSGKKKQTASDRELDKYFRQLYLYSAAVSSEYDREVAELRFNCFRKLDENIIKEQFHKEKLEETERWVKETVEEIATCEDFDPSVEWFKCRYLCEFSHLCEYFNESD